MTNIEIIAFERRETTRVPTLKVLVHYGRDRRQLFVASEKKVSERA